MVYGNIFLEKFDIKELINKKKEEKARKAEEKRLESLSMNETEYPIRFIKEHPKINQKFLDDLFELYPREAAGIALIYGKYKDSDIIKFIQSNCNDASKIIKNFDKKNENKIISKLGANSSKDIKFITATDDHYVFFYNNKFLIYEDLSYSEILTLEKLRSLGNKNIKEYEQDCKDVAEYLGVKI